MQAGDFQPARRERQRDKKMASPYGVNRPAKEDEEDHPMDRSDVLVTQAPALARNQASSEIRSVAVPPHRRTAVTKSWKDLLEPLVKNMKLQVKFEPRRNEILVRAGPGVEDVTCVQKGCDYLTGFLLGFSMDVLALLRLDDLYIETFEIKDVKTLQGDHLGRAVGRISGKKGATKNAIENATRTRIVLADRKLHVLGSFQNIKLARRSICSLILGQPTSKVYTHLRNVARRMNERL